MDHSIPGYGDNGFFDPNAQDRIDRDRIDKYGELIDDLEGADRDGANRRGVKNQRDLFGFYEDNEPSQYTHHTPEPIEDVSILFDKGDGVNKPLEVDLSDSLDGSENDIVYYHKEDLTNFSKNLGLNVVKPRPLPEIGLLGSESGTPTSRRKGKNKLRDRSHDIQKKLGLLSEIYENEPENSRRNRSKAFGYPLPHKLDDSSHSAGIGHNQSKAHERSSISQQLRKKLNKRKKTLEKQALEERKKQFKALDIDSKRLRDKAYLAQKKARKRLKKRVTDYTFYLDYESPYAEYLPALYREWQPKEPKRAENNFMNIDNSRIGDKLDEVSHIYKNEAPGSANTSAIHSRSGKRKSKPKNKAESALSVAGGLSLAQHLDPKHRTQLSYFDNKRVSQSNRKDREESKGRKPIILDNYDDTLDLDSDNEPLKVFQAKETKPNQAPKPKKKHNSSMVKSERGPHIVPSGMDIEDAR